MTNPVMHITVTVGNEEFSVEIEARFADGQRYPINLIPGERENLARWLSTRIRVAPDTPPAKKFPYLERNSIPVSFLRRLAETKLPESISLNIVRVYYAHNFLGEYLYAHRSELIPHESIVEMTRDLAELPSSLPPWPEVETALATLTPEGQQTLNGHIGRILLYRDIVRTSPPCESSG